jgi:hypothetical protein
MLCVFCQKQRKMNVIQALGMQHLVRVSPNFELYFTRLHFWGPNDIKLEAVTTQIKVNITTVINELIFLSKILLMK